MASNASTYLENHLLEHSLGVNAFTMPGTVYCGLYTIAPTSAGGGTEVSGGAYARQAVSWNRASAGAITNATDITFPSATAVWGTIVAIGVFDSNVGGNLLWFGQTAAARTVNIGDVWKVLAGSLAISIS